MKPNRSLLMNSVSNYGMNLTERTIKTKKSRRREFFVKTYKMPEKSLK